jgi:hypothetical protein
VSGATVGAFVVRLLLWLPACFALWALAAPYHASIAGGFAQIWVAFLAPGLLTTIDRSETSLAFVTTLLIHPAPGQDAILVPEVAARVYTYGVAMLMALMLAARARGWKIVAGLALLLPFQGFGLAFDFLAQVGIGLGPAVSAQTGFTSWQREAIALGYQVGSVILPSLAPVIVWAALCQPFIASLARRSPHASAFAPRPSAAPFDLPPHVRQRTD